MMMTDWAPLNDHALEAEEEEEEEPLQERRQERRTSMNNKISLADSFDKQRQEERLKDVFQKTTSMRRINTVSRASSVPAQKFEQHNGVMVTVVTGPIGRHSHSGRGQPTSSRSMRRQSTFPASSAMIKRSAATRGLSRVKDRFKESFKKRLSSRKMEKLTDGASEDYSSSEVEMPLQVGDNEAQALEQSSPKRCPSKQDLLLRRAKKEDAAASADNNEDQPSTNKTKKSSSKKKNLRKKLIKEAIVVPVIDFKQTSSHQTSSKPTTPLKLPSSNSDHEQSTMNSSQDLSMALTTFTEEAFYFDNKKGHFCSRPSERAAAKRQEEDEVKRQQEEAEAERKQAEADAAAAASSRRSSKVRQVMKDSSSKRNLLKKDPSIRKQSSKRELKQLKDGSTKRNVKEGLKRHSSRDRGMKAMKDSSSRRSSLTGSSREQSSRDRGMKAMKDSSSRRGNLTGSSREFKADNSGSSQQRKLMSRSESRGTGTGRRRSRSAVKGQLMSQSMSNIQKNPSSNNKITVKSAMVHKRQASKKQAQPQEEEKLQRKESSRNKAKVTADMPDLKVMEAEIGSSLPVRATNRSNRTSTWDWTPVDTRA